MTYFRKLILLHSVILFCNFIYKINLNEGNLIISCLIFKCTDLEQVDFKADTAQRDQIYVEQKL